MASETADESGFATDATIAHYSRLARSGAGLVMVEYAHVHPSGRSEALQLGIQSDAHVPGLAKISEAIRRTGALAGIQLTHAGGKTSRELTGGALLAPSEVPVPVKEREMDAPDPMSSREISLWKAAFADGVTRAVQAGFDLVEFHAAHGYGLNQWLSPITNRRDDGYGGSPERNSRLLLEIVEQARARYPALLLAVRVPGQDFLEGGLRIEDTARLARTLERLGLDLVDVSSGIGGWKRPPERTGQGYLVPEASAIQAAVRIPVIGVGGIEQGAYVDEALREGKLSLAAVGRAILKGPEAWRERNLMLLGDIISTASVTG